MILPIAASSEPSATFTRFDLNSSGEMFLYDKVIEYICIVMSMLIQLCQVAIEYQIRCIVVKMSERFHISLTDALDIFYKSNTCRRFHDEKTGLYLYGDNYIVEELVREYQN